MVRRTAAPRQQPRRRPARDLHTRADRGDRVGRQQGDRPDGHRDQRDTARGGCRDPPFPRARPGVGRRRRREGDQGARPRLGRDASRSGASRSTRSRPAARLDRLALLSRRVEELWAESAAEVDRFWKATRQHIEVWGADTPEAGERFGDEPIRTVLRDPRSATSRLRTLMDAWCSLWLWAPQHGTELPTLDEWLTVAEALLRIDEPWDSGALFADERELALPEGASIDDIAAAHPWLARAREIATAQGWFHWELEFAPVFARGGFDLQVGNPPWVRLVGRRGRARRARPVVRRHRSDADPRERSSAPAVRTPSLTTQAQLRAVPRGARRDLPASVTHLCVPRRGSRSSHGIRTNLYLVFMTGHVAADAAATGAVGLLHPDGASQPIRRPPLSAPRRIAAIARHSISSTSSMRSTGSKRLPGRL